ncbi:enoyl-CoA hydratase/isomerase family protein [Nocardioides sp. NPDC087217]|uniref:enoyl-CoA hydratase/isomerase family protein n=1 Tax=Nocardioides sp. NPDC087217 TaxID=3364335 RepID=UPI00380583F0
MSTPSSVAVDRPSPKVVTITFSNPPVNVVTAETALRLHEIVTGLENDPDVQVVVFKSDVPDFFLNHFDLAAVGDLPTPAEGELPLWTDLVVRLSTARYITVGSIRGRARGAGSELALALDLRYASLENAYFGQPEVGIGILPGGGGTEHLPRLLGRDRALEAILTSSDYDAAQAERWGWVTRALPDAELDAFVDDMVARLAASDAQALAAAKVAVNRSTLPPERDLVAAFGEFVQSLGRPGFQARAAAIAAIGAEVGLDFEYRMGEHIAQANQQL